MMRAEKLAGRWSPVFRVSTWPKIVTPGNINPWNETSVPNVMSQNMTAERSSQSDDASLRLSVSHFGARCTTNCRDSSRACRCDSKCSAQVFQTCFAASCACSPDRPLARSVARASLHRRQSSTVSSRVTTAPLRIARNARVIRSRNGSHPIMARSGVFAALGKRGRTAQDSWRPRQERDAWLPCCTA